MKIFIQVLDNGYTLSVTEVAELDDGSQHERKQRFAFETREALARKLNELLRFDADPMEEEHGE